MHFKLASVTPGTKSTFIFPFRGADGVGFSTYPHNSAFASFAGDGSAYRHSGYFACKPVWHRLDGDHDPPSASQAASSSIPPALPPTHLKVASQSCFSIRAVEATLQASLSTESIPWHRLSSEASYMHPLWACVRQVCVCIDAGPCHAAGSI